MKYLFLGIIKLYRLTLSKMLPPCCRYHPSCSEYATVAIRRFGAVKGGYLALWRIIRCNPYGRGGYDPVPQRFMFRPDRVHCDPPFLEDDGDNDANTAGDRIDI